jgi:hypothetical protein
MFTLNDWEDPATLLTRQWTNQVSYTRLQQVEGIHDAPDMDDPRVKLVYQSGELPLPRLGRGRTITYTGILAAQTMSDMRNAVSALRACVMSGIQSPTAWLVSVAYNSTYDTSGLAFAAYGIPVGFTCPDTQPAATVLPSPYQRQFTLSFRQSDGRWSVTPSAFLCTCGSSASKIDDGSAGTLTLTGTAPGEPTFTVYGTGSGEATIVLTAAEVSGQLTIDLPAKMGDGDTLVVNFGQRTITYTPSGGAATDYSGYLDMSAGNWWNEADVVPTLLIGDNTLEVVGDKWSASCVPMVW